MFSSNLRCSQAMAAACVVSCLAAHLCAQQPNTQFGSPPPQYTAIPQVHGALPSIPSAPTIVPGVTSFPTQQYPEYQGPPPTGAGAPQQSVHYGQVSQSAPLHADQVRALVDAANTLEQAGQLDGAISQYENALVTYPTNRTLLIHYGRMLHRIGRIDQAIAVYSRSLSANPLDPIAMNDLGLCFARKNQLDNAAQLIGSAINLNPNSKRYRNNMAKVLIAMGRNQEAFSHLERAHGGDLAHFNMAFLLNARGQKAAAAEYAQVACAMNPGLVDARNLLNSLQNNPVLAANQRLSAPANAPTQTPQQTPPQQSPPHVADRHSWSPGSVERQSATLQGDDALNVKFADWYSIVEGISVRDENETPEPPNLTPSVYNGPYQAFE